MKREQKREQTKRLLLDAVKELICEKGCTNTTLNDIMERSGLSKGAIFHYVKSKDELFSWVLEDRLDEINGRFFNKASQKKSFEEPMHEITARLSDLENPQDPGNQVLMYLLGKSDQLDVKNILQQYYEQAIHMSKLWIAAGQEAGVIPQSVDADKTAELFMLISFGLRMRGAIDSKKHFFHHKDFAELMSGMLQPKEER
ncbi:TetR/AcrR family transcriptional regulator [Aeribacillus composti]|uniref:TetR/AcrR family transcriptional regulator n=1 Tax=Aeribacillus TaxID=1055323 RepID=UPI0007B4A107|nr:MULTISPECIES: TetR/AcrR family transcriptional regulator [Aeribacillus]KZM55331.1 TetR family transcriptional regulator [Aeribacillus pallidus]MED0651953.1 TetR/AcrR family transcriptional regulator [Aeribacillus composti]MED0715604.1 TetR/AcrR family transcriptional regulator [Aeribacillus composti]MED0745314.1 TetR/AcrR family transcriptional regulator [Aeribacillus composti]MED4485399.1 TetR/AcrR family transcriptional regulator [Aeribacillus pallidus]